MKTMSKMKTTKTIMKNEEEEEDDDDDDDEDHGADDDSYYCFIIMIMMMIVIVLLLSIINYYHRDDEDDLDLMATRCWFQEFCLYPSYCGEDFPFERHFPYIFQPNRGEFCGGDPGKCLLKKVHV